MSQENGDKQPLDGPSERSWRRIFTKNILSLLLAVLLVLLSIVVTIQFFYPILKYESEDVEKEIVPTHDSDNQDLDFTINPKRLCKTSQDVQLLVAVASDAKNADRRRAIRETWGSMANKSHPIMRLAFVVGATQDPKLKAALREESFLYRDVIQGPTGTPKSVAMLKWVAQYCSQAHYFLKADDDTFVNLEVVAELLGRKPFNTHPKFIGGHVVETATTTPETSEGHDFDNQTDHISGSVYLTRGPTIKDLHQAFMELLPLTDIMDSYLEDAFVTGTVRSNVGITLVHEPLFGLQPCFSMSCDSFASAPGISPFDMQFIWDQMQSSDKDQLQSSDGDSTVQEAIKLDDSENVGSLSSIWNLLFKPEVKYEKDEGKAIQEPTQESFFKEIAIKDDGGEVTDRKTSDIASYIDEGNDDASSVEMLPLPMPVIMLI